MKRQERAPFYLNVIAVVVALAALLVWPGTQAATSRTVFTTEREKGDGRRIVVSRVDGPMAEGVAMPLATVVVDGTDAPTDDEDAGASADDEIAEAMAAPLATYVVDRTDDNASATACTSAANDCSLRGAIIKANTTMGMDTIMVPAGTYTLTIAGTGEDAAATGDLDLTESVTIMGAGASSTIIQAGASAGSGIDRVFHVTSSGVTAKFMNLTIRHGKTSSLEDGGGILNDGGTVEISHSTVTNNTSDSDGGGILNSSGMVEIKQSVLSNNVASAGVSGNGGGILNDGGMVKISNSTVSGNSGDAGGGIFNLGTILNVGTVEISNSTVSNNTSNDGGGIFNSGHGTVEISNSTLSGNSASFYGGGIFYGGTVTIKNSIVANSPSGGNCVSFFGTWTAIGQNFDTDGSCPGFTAVTSMQLNLGPLQNNGGPTATHALLSGSVAVDAVTDCTDVNGSPVTDDQRGVMRPIDGDGDGTPECDVGAYEAPVCTAERVPPQITCPMNRTIGTQAPACTATATYVATATDNCSGVSVICTPPSGSTFALGTTTVSCKATDAGGNMATCTFTVTVVDDDGPQITCPANITIGTQAPNCSATASYVATATDNCPGLSVTCTPPSGSTFALGTTTVSCKATDAGGNMATCTFTVTVVDDDAPTITCPANQTVQAGANCQATVSVGTATATDNCTPSGSITITGTRSDGQPLTAPYPGPNGVGSQVTTITWKATDAAGNMATCTQTITVTNAAPTANAGTTQTVDEGTLVTLSGSGTDPNPGQTLSFQWTQTGGPAVVINNANTATATFTAPEVGTLECVNLTFQLKVTDACGAMATSSVVVRVQDTLVLQDDADPTKCVVIRRDCGATNSGTYCMKVGGVTFTGPLTVTQQGNTVNAQSTAADPNVAQGSIDLGRCRGNFRLTITRNVPTVTHTIVSNVNACDDVCTCP